MTELIANSPTPGSRVALTTLATAQSSTTSLTFDMGAAAPTKLQGSSGDQFRCDLGSEIVIFDAANVSTSTWTALQRGAEGSTAATHAAGTEVFHDLTEGALQALISGASGVSSVTAGDASIVVGGTASAPTLETGTLDVIATDHPPAADWSNNSHKITSVADPTSAQDAATKNYVDSHGGASTTTKRVCLPIGAAGVQMYNYSSGFDVANRYLLKLPKTPTRFRLRIANYGALTDAAGTGTITLSGAWMGTPNFTASSPGRWNGQLTAAGTQVWAGGTITDGSDLVTPWIDNTGGIHLQAGVLAALSVGASASAAATVAFDSNIRSCWFGAGSAANAGAANPGTAFDPGTLLDVRIDYEYAEQPDRAVSIVAMIGDSITQGWMFPSEPNWSSHYECWPDASGLRQGFAVCNMGVGSTDAGHAANAGSWSKSFTDWKWTRAAAWSQSDIGSVSAIPDAAVIALGTNDISEGETSQANIEAWITEIAAQLKTIGIPRVYVATVIPRYFTGTQESCRTALNNLFRQQLPNGIDGVFDFDKLLRVQGAVNNTTASLTNGQGSSGTPITVANAGTIQVGATLFAATGFNGATTVTAISGTSVTLSKNSNATAAGVALTFVNPDTGMCDPDFGVATGSPHPTLAGHQRMADIVRFAA